MMDPRDMVLIVTHKLAIHNLDFVQSPDNNLTNTKVNMKRISGEPEFALSFLSRSINSIYKIYSFYSLYKLWESAISHLLALHRLRHGTSPINYVKIQMRGLVPEQASKSDGEATYYRLTKKREPEKREVFVYVMRDESVQPCRCKKWKMCKKFYITKRKDPREYAFKSGSTMLACENVSQRVQHILMWIGGVAGFLTPTLQFHFDPKEDAMGLLFEPDPWLGCVALRTSQNISAKRLGLLGALRFGLNARIWARIQEDPKKALVGVIQLLAAMSITSAFRKNGLCLERSQHFPIALAKLAMIHAIFFSAV